MKLVSKAVLVLYVLTLLWLILFKFSFNISLASYQAGLNLIPFANSSHGSMWELIANFVVFIPLGLLLSVNLKRSSFWHKLAFAFAFSVAVEAIQLVCAIGTADITDVIMNTSGGLLGLLLYALGSSTYTHQQKLDRHITSACMAVMLVLAGILASGIITLQSAPGAKATLSSVAATTNLQLTWPTTGEAAVGTTKDGLLARAENTENPRPIASMAKIITALAIMDKQPLMLGQPGKSYTITAQDVTNYRAEMARGGSVVPVYEGMVLTEYQALQAMLLASANNIADMLVERTFASDTAYRSYAQDMLRRNGYHRTIVADASGYNPSTVSTPSEVVALGIEALSNPVIAEIVAQQQAHIPGVGVIQNTNQLLGTDGVIGLKTGTTDQAGRCLLFAARYAAKDGTKVTIVGVIIGATDTAALFSDSKKLLESARQGLDLLETASL